MKITMAIAKVVLAGGLLGLILWKLPILELAYMFVMIVMVPLAALAAIGVIGQGTIDTVRLGSAGFRKQVDAWLVKLQEQANNKEQQVA